MKLVKTKCTNCGASLKVNPDLDNVKCNYCGAELLIDDEATQLKRIENVKLEARKANYEQDIIEEKERKEIAAAEKYKNGIRSKLMVIIIIISVILTIAAPTIPGKLIFVVQVITLVSAWLIGMRVIKEPFNGFRTILLVVAFFLLIGALEANIPSDIKYIDYEWSDFVLGYNIPEVKNSKVKISTNTNDSLNLYFNNYDKEKYNEYVKKCKELGYTIESNTNSTNYTAYNSDGYELRIYFSSSNSRMSVRLNAPIEMREIDWPTGGIGSTLPKVKTLYGNITTDSESSFYAHVGKMTIEDFEDYVKECKKAGYDVDYRKYEKSYSAKNKKGNSLSIYYLGNNVASIYLVSE